MDVGIHGSNRPFPATRPALAQTRANSWINWFARAAGSSLHTSSAPSTVDRIIDQFPADHAKAVDKVGLLSMFKKAGIDTSWVPAEAAPGT